MKKLALITLVILALTTVVINAHAAGTISTTFWGDGTLEAGKTGREHVTHANVSTGTVEKVIVKFTPIKIIHTKPRRLVVRLNGEKICRFGQRRLKSTVSCFAGDILPGDTLDSVLIFRAKSVGVDEWYYFVQHDGWWTDFGFSLTIK